MKEASRKTAIILFIVRFFRLLVSVATLSVSAHYFGVNLDRESWILSLNFVVVINLALWGPLNETFRAKFIFLKASEGEDAALKRTSNLIIFTLVVLTGLIILLEIFSFKIAHLLAPAYAPHELEKVSLLLRYLLWSALISQATQLLSSILNTYDSFYIPEICGFFSAIINFAIIVFLSPVIGIFSFVLANYISAFILLLALIYQIKKLNIRLFKDKISISWPQVKPFILFSIPFFLPYIIGQMNSLIEKSISNVLGHSAVGIIDYSKKITDILQTVLTSVLATIMVPVLSSSFAAGKIENVAAESQKYLQLIFLMLAFFIPVLLVCATPVTDILYNKGSISIPDLEQISLLIKLYAISLISIFTYLVFGLILLSINKSKTYAVLGMLAQLLMIGINFLTYKKMGIFTFVFALTASHLITAFILFFKLPFAKSALGFCILKYGALILSVSVSVLALSKYVFSPANSYLNVLYNSILAIVCGLIFSYILQINELKQLKQFAGKLNKFRK